jgi:cytochrome c oxidase subunit III
VADRVIPLPVRYRVASDGAVGMLIFVLTELMVFAGLISAFSILKVQAVGGWPPANQPRLPIEATAFNTLALLVSGALMLVASRAYRQAPERARTPLLASMALGAFFVLFQGAEWVTLIGQGLTLTTSTHGSFFYLIVGLHALHAIGALLALSWAVLMLQRGVLKQSAFSAVQIFWYFVVGIWPILYWQVYL